MKVSRDKVQAEDKRLADVEREFVLKAGNEVIAALSPDGKTVVAAGKDHVCFFDVITGQERRYERPNNVKPEFLFRIQAIKFSADSSRIALVGSEGKVQILAVKDGRRIAEFATKSRTLTALAFSPDAQTLLTTSLDAPVYAWEVATGQMVRRFESATYLYSPDNRLLAGATGTLKVFDLYSGRVIRECKAEGTGFGNFAFSPNSKLLAASCSDTTILVWPTSTADTKTGKPLDEKSLLEVLEKGNATDAYLAIGLMIADPERAISFLERRLRSVPKIEAKHVQLLIADLDSDQANRREAATTELAILGTLVEPALRVALSSEKVPLGSQRRIEKLLRDLDEKQTVISAEEVLHLRGIQAAGTDWHEPGPATAGEPCAGGGDKSANAGSGRGAFACGGALILCPMSHGASPLQTRPWRALGRVTRTRVFLRFPQRLSQRQQPSCPCQRSMPIDDGQTLQATLAKSGRPEAIEWTQCIIHKYLAELPRRSSDVFRDGASLQGVVSEGAARICKQAGSGAAGRETKLISPGVIHAQPLASNVIRWHLRLEGLCRGGEMRRHGDGGGRHTECACYFARLTFYKCVARPCSNSAASLMVSVNVGCG